MPARLEPTQPLTSPDLRPEDDAFVRDAEFKALRRLSKLIESEDERVALRAAAVLIRYFRERRREARVAAEPPRAKTEVKPSAEGEKRTIPRGLVEPSRPAPAFRAVPLASVTGARDPGATRMG